MAHGTCIFQEETSLTSRDRKETDENSNKGKQTENISRFSFAFSLLISITISKIIIAIGFFLTLIIFLEVLVQIIVLSYKYTNIRAYILPSHAVVFLYLSANAFLVTTTNPRESRLPWLIGYACTADCEYVSICLFHDLFNFLLPSLSTDSDYMKSRSSSTLIK